jgi:hypothetical protein
LQTAFNHMLSDISDIISQEEKEEPESLLRRVMLYFLEGAVGYPGIIKAILHEPINNNNYDGAVMQQVLQFINRLVSQAALFSKGDHDTVKEKILQIISVSLMPALLPELFGMVLGEDFNSNAEKQRDYIDKYFKA